jgi:hypothetical protein
MQNKDRNLKLLPRACPTGRLDKKRHVSDSSTARRELSGAMAAASAFDLAKTRAIPRIPGLTVSEVN